MSSISARRGEQKKRLRTPLSVYLHQSDRQRDRSGSQTLPHSPNVFVLHMCCLFLHQMSPVLSGLGPHRMAVAVLSWDNLNTTQLFHSYVHSWCLHKHKLRLLGFSAAFMSNLWGGVEAWMTERFDDVGHRSLIGSHEPRLKVVNATRIQTLLTHLSLLVTDFCSLIIVSRGYKHGRTSTEPLGAPAATRLKTTYSCQGFRTLGSVQTSSVEVFQCVLGELSL